MPYKTRPYLRNTFGIVSDPFVQYEVHPGKIIKIPLIGPVGTFSWSGTASAKADPEEKRNMFGLGDVRVSANGNSEVYRNLRSINSFMSAVRGEHPDVNADIRAQQALEHPWYENLTSDDLDQEHVVCLEPLPEIIDHLLWAEKARSSAKTFGLVGQWHKQGEIMYQMAMLPIVAPTQGQFRGAFTEAYNDGYREFLEQNGFTRGIKYTLSDASAVSGFFVPQKGMPTKFKLGDIYGWDTLEKRIKPYLIGKALPGRYKGDEEFGTRLAQAYEIIKTKDLKVVPVSALPQFHTQLEQRFFASGAKVQDFVVSNSYGSPNGPDGVS